MQYDYDLIVIGGGSGGLAVAETAAALGKHVAIIDGAAVGGTCVHRGCVPKKIMWVAAQLAQAVDDANGFGVPAARCSTDWQKLLTARDEYIAGIQRYWEAHLVRHAIDFIPGWARFVDAHRIMVGSRSYRAEHVVLATGGRPWVPPVPGAELGLTSDEVFRLRAQPQRIAIIGGGYIGVELAGVLQALGSQVVLFALEARLLERFDAMIGEVLATEMQRQGIAVHLEQQVVALSRKQGKTLIHLASGKVHEGFDAVIWAVGRKPNTSGIGLGRAGVTVLDDGHIAVDACQNTNVPGIYAIGDITGQAALTPVAIRAGRSLAKRLFAHDTSACLETPQVPSVVFSHPPVGTVGLSEEQARREYARVSVYETRFTPMRHALSANAGQTAMKLICAGVDERIVGLHLIGDGVDEMLQGFAVAISMGAKKADFDRTLAIHPVSAEELVTLKDEHRVRVHSVREVA